MFLYELKELLKIFELDYFPTREEIKKLFKEKIKKYHPDKNKDLLAHEKTIKLMKAYQSFLIYYNYYEEEYSKFFQKKEDQVLLNQHKEKDDINQIQIYLYKNFYLGFPLYGLELFIDKKDAIILQKQDNYYIFYNNFYYKIEELNKNLIEKIHQKNYYCFVLYKKPYFYSLCIQEKIKYIDTIKIDTIHINWDKSYGTIIYNQNTIYIPSLFKNLYLYNDEFSMSTYQS
ncbi:MAG: hypothetical protein KatS3mg129_1373 [Leptospiraceae bacterium]|nr:MAG: hypothetical protein KatS3mg129_1373 [Leptospiraceae bacterium]